MPRDVDGSDLQRLLASAAKLEPTVATVIPQLHAIGATRTCIDLKRPHHKQYFWRGKTDGVWYSHALFRDTARSRRRGPR